MASEHYRMVHARVVRRIDARPAIDPTNFSEDWRRSCGCIRTSDKLKEILKTFPSPPPPSPVYETPCITCKNTNGQIEQSYEPKIKPSTDVAIETSKPSSRWWVVVLELVQLLQLTVTATALALYYLIYCYMQLVYYTLRSALYFHNADGPMKITIGVVTATSLVVGFNLLIRMQRLLKIY